MVSFVDENENISSCKFCGFLKQENSKYRFIWAKYQKNNCDIKDFDTCIFDIPYGYVIGAPFVINLNLKPKTLVKCPLYIISLFEYIIVGDKHQEYCIERII